MSWKKWKRGLFVACLTGLATGGGGLIIGVTWRQAAILLLATIGKDVFLYLKNHPIESITDTDVFPKP